MGSGLENLPYYWFGISLLCCGHLLYFFTYLFVHAVGGPDAFDDEAYQRCLATQTAGVMTVLAGLCQMVTLGLMK